VLIASHERERASGLAARTVTVAGGVVTDDVIPFSEPSKRPVHVA